MTIAAVVLPLFRRAATARALDRQTEHDVLTRNVAGAGA
jgi:hypothetical protein